MSKGLTHLVNTKSEITDKKIAALNRKYAKNKRFKDSTAVDDLNSYFYHIADTRTTPAEKKIARKGIISTTGSAKFADEYISKRKALKEFPDGYFAAGGKITPKIPKVSSEDILSAIKNITDDYASKHPEVKVKFAGGGFFTNIIGDKKAREIIRYALELASQKGVELPKLRKFMEEGAKPGILLEAYIEYNYAVNNGNNPNSIRLDYQNSNRFREYVMSHFPNLTQREMYDFYGKASIAQTFPNYEKGGGIDNKKAIKVSLHYPLMPAIKVELEKGDPESWIRQLKDDRWVVKYDNLSQDFPTKKEAEEEKERLLSFKSWREKEIYDAHAYYAHLKKRMGSERKEFREGIKPTALPKDYSKVAEYLNFMAAKKIERLNPNDLKLVPKGTYFKFKHFNYGVERITEFVLDEVVCDKIFGWINFGGEWKWADYIFFDYDDTRNSLCIGSGSEILFPIEIVSPPNNFKLPVTEKFEQGGGTEMAKGGGDLFAVDNTKGDYYNSFTEYRWDEKELWKEDRSVFKEFAKYKYSELTPELKKKLLEYVKEAYLQEGRKIGDETPYGYLTKEQFDKQKAIENNRFSPSVFSGDEKIALEKQLKHGLRDLIQEALLIMWKAPKTKAKNEVTKQPSYFSAFSWEAKKRAEEIISESENRTGTIDWKEHSERLMSLIVKRMMLREESSSGANEDDCKRAAKEIVDMWVTYKGIKFAKGGGVERFTKEEIKSWLKTVGDLDDIFNKIKEIYGNKVPVFHATTTEGAKLIEKGGLGAVPINNRKFWGDMEGFYVQIGSSDYVSKDRPKLFYAEPTISYLTKYADADTDGSVSDKEAEAELGISLDELDTNTRDFVVAIITNDYKFDGLELLLHSEDTMPPLKIIKFEKRRQ